MRHPNHAIPSPRSSSGAAQDYWQTPPRSAAPANGWDPLCVLRTAHDILGIDRRLVARQQDTAPQRSDASPLHRTVSMRLGLRCAEGWALVQTIAASPSGLLVRAVDWRHATAGERAALAAAMRGLCASTLEMVGTCVLSAALIADLARWANPPAPQRPRETPVTLVSLPQRPDEAVIEVAGRITSLTDPNPKTLAIACSDEGVQQLASVLHAGTLGGERRVTAPGSTQWVASTASARCLNTRE